MQKRGQITVFIIVGIVLLIGLGLMFFTLRSPRSVDVALDTVSLEGESRAMETFVNSCLKETLLESVDNIPIKQEYEEYHEEFVEKQLDRCTKDFAYFRKQGVNVASSDPTVKVRIDERLVTADLSMPLTLKMQDKSSMLTDFSASINRISTLSESGSMSSGDRKAELFVSPGTLITKQGTPIKSLSMNMFGKDFGGLDNLAIVGGKFYDIGPDGAEYSPEAELSISYEDVDIPKGVAVSSLSIATFDNRRDTWIALPSIVDAEKKKVTAKIKHNSPYPLMAGCGDEQIVPFGWLYREPCYIGDREKISCSPRWTTGPQGQIYWLVDDDQVKVDERFNTDEAGNKRCVKDDWDNNSETKPTYGYSNAQKVSGSGSFVFKIIQGGANTCDGGDMTLYVRCDDKCGNVYFNNNLLQAHPKDKSDKYYNQNDLTTFKALRVPSEIIERAGKDNVVKVEVLNEHEHCSGAYAYLEYKGTGALPACREGKTTRNCRCGVSGSINLPYDFDNLNALMERKKQKYDELSDDDLATAIKDNKESFCCDGQVSDKSCSGAPAAPAAGAAPAPGQPVQPPQPAPLSQCSVQDRIDYVCRYGPDNDQNYNPRPHYPACSGTVNGKKVGFSDPKAEEELLLLSGLPRDRKLSQVAEYSGRSVVCEFGQTAQPTTPAAPGQPAPAQPVKPAPVAPAPGQPVAPVAPTPITPVAPVSPVQPDDLGKPAPVQLPKKSENCAGPGFVYASEGNLYLDEGKFSFVGFNVHGLSRASDDNVREVLKYLSSDCGVNVIRVWGYQTSHGMSGAEGLRRILKLSKDYNVKFIVSFEDFAHGPPNEGADAIPKDSNGNRCVRDNNIFWVYWNSEEHKAKNGDCGKPENPKCERCNEPNPSSWYSYHYKVSYDGYQDDNYKDYVRSIVKEFKDDDQILAWEIINEPHCTGYDSCVGPMHEFIKDMTLTIKEDDPNHMVTVGTYGLFHRGERKEKGEYQAIHSTQFTIGRPHGLALVSSKQQSLYGVDIATANYNYKNFPDVDGRGHKEHVYDDIQISNDLGKPFYINELWADSALDSGTMCSSSDCDAGCPASELESRAGSVSQEMDVVFGKGGDGFLIWQFSLPRNGALGCDQFTFFKNDPVCSKVKQKMTQLCGEGYQSVESPYSRANSPLRTQPVSRGGERDDTGSTGDAPTGSTTTVSLIPREMLCIHTELEGSDDSADRQLSLAKSAGSTYIKQVFWWASAARSTPQGLFTKNPDEVTINDIKSAQTNYDWEEFDMWYEKANSKRLKFVPRLSFSPAWSRTEYQVNTEYYNSPYCTYVNRDKYGTYDCMYNNRPDMDKMHYFGNYVYSFVKRYKPDYVQVWNEPNFAVEWTNKGVSPKEYAQMLRIAKLAVDEASRETGHSTKIIMGGLGNFWTNTFQQACNNENWKGREGQQYLSCDSASSLPDTQGMYKYDEAAFIQKMHEDDPNSPGYYDIIGLNLHPHSETEPGSRCGEGQALTNPGGKEVGNDILGEYPACFAVDRIRKIHEKFPDKKVTIIEFSYLLNNYVGFKKDMSRVAVAEEEEVRQAKFLEQAYIRASSEFGSWMDGPICWFIASSPGRWGDENMLTTTGVRSSACAFSKLSGGTLISENLDDCRAYLGIEKQPEGQFI